MTTFLEGAPLLDPTFSTACTTSMPSTTLPNTTWRPSSHEVWKGWKEGWKEGLGRQAADVVCAQVQKLMASEVRRACATLAVEEGAP